MPVHGSTYARALLGLSLLGAGVPAADAGEPSALPAPFVFLRDIDASIVQDMRYAVAGNFTGVPLPGYGAGECVLTRATALALARAQAALRRQAPGLSLKVYDCYRPARAVQALKDWAQRPSDGGMFAYHHPRLPRRSLVAQGYIASRSGHSRGHTIDLTIATAPGGSAASAPISTRLTDCGGPADARESDGSLDMGTAYDCFDPRAHTFAAGIDPAAAASRRRLVALLATHGFHNYAKEWWHFTFAAGDSGAAHDFPVPARPVP